MKYEVRYYNEKTRDYDVDIVTKKEFLRRLEGNWDDPEDIIKWLLKLGEWRQITPFSEGRVTKIE